MSLPRLSLSSCSPFVIASALALTSALGCSSTDDASGAPPTLKDLVLQSTTVDVGKQSTIAGTVTIEDADGDIASLLAEITPPGGAAAQALPESKVANAAGVTSAPVQLGVILVLPVAGEYKLAVWAKDTAGHESAKIVQTLTAK